MAIRKYGVDYPRQFDCRYCGRHVDFTKFKHTRTAQISIDLFMFFADNWKPCWDYKHSWNPFIENSYGKKTNLDPDEIMYIGDALIPIWKELTNAVRKN